MNLPLNPSEIRTREFPLAMRGYAKNEVDSYLERIANEFEHCHRELTTLRAEHEQLKEKHAVLAQLEDTLKAALIEAQKSAENIITRARREAEKLVTTASVAVERLHAESEREAELLLERRAQSKAILKSYVAATREVIDEHLRSLDHIITDGDTQPAAVSDEEKREGRPPIAECPEPSVADSAPVESSAAVAPVHVDAPIEVKRVTNSAKPTDALEVFAARENSTETPLVASSSDDDEFPEATATTRGVKADIECTFALDDTESVSPTESGGQQASTVGAGGVTLSSALAISRAAAAALKAKSGAPSEPPALPSTLAKISLSPTPRTTPAFGQRGPDGIVVFGRREDRERAYQENARILNDLDDVVERFATQMSERERK